jgi:hypothetical protein
VRGKKCWEPGLKLLSPASKRLVQCKFANRIVRKGWRREVGERREVERREEKTQCSINSSSI